MNNQVDTRSTSNTIGYDLRLMHCSEESFARYGQSHEARAQLRATGENGTRSQVGTQLCGAIVANWGELCYLIGA